MSAAYDLVVIGSGPAGQSAAELATFLGHSTLVVERGLPGGAVTAHGGVPTKTLREIAVALGRAQRSGTSAGGTSTATAGTMEILRARTVDVCRSLQAGIADQLRARGIEYVRGSARLSSNRIVTIDRGDGQWHNVTARSIVLATGSAPVRGPGVPFDDPDVYDSDKIFAMQRLPDRIVIVGAGPVGVEFATIFATLGVPVTLIDHGDRLLPNMDRELATLMAEELTRCHVALVLEASVDVVSRSNGELSVRLSNGSLLQTSAVLFAAGRTANVRGLGLDAAGIELDPRGRIVVDRYFQTTSPGVYAVGDAVRPTLASIAMQQGRAAVCHAFGLVFGIPVDRGASAAVYGVPELAGVGATEEQVRNSGTPYVVGRCDLSRTARGAIAGRGGQLKLIVGADDRKLLGIHCIGDIASELIGMGHAVLHMSGTIDVFLTLALNTPTYSSAYRDAAIDAIQQLAALGGRRTSLSNGTIQTATSEAATLLMSGEHP